ncbi:MAG: glutathione S-transferase N-terminal domain-containing protein [Coriobacteriia bacterium]|nr:glutathione S-transferase N-terminal domain-containing protein [Coriobacteriia bacterium]
MPELTLYGRTSCPYCVKVMRFMQSRHINIPIKDTTDPANREELIRIGGKGQVPCLVIDGKALYESMDIIAWMQQNLLK